MRSACRRSTIWRLCARATARQCSWAWSIRSRQKAAASASGAGASCFPPQSADDLKTLRAATRTLASTGESRGRAPAGLGRRSPPPINQWMRSGQRAPSFAGGFDRRAGRRSRSFSIRTSAARLTIEVKPLLADEAPAGAWPGCRPGERLDRALCPQSSCPRIGTLTLAEVQVFSDGKQHRAGRQREAVQHRLRRRRRPRHRRQHRRRLRQRLANPYR